MGQTAPFWKIVTLPRLLLIEDDDLQRAAIGRLTRSEYSVVEVGTADPLFASELSRSELSQAEDAAPP